MKKSAGRKLRRNANKKLQNEISKSKQKLNDHKYGKVPKNA